MNEEAEPATAATSLRLRELLAAAGMQPLEPPELAARFAGYCLLLQRWNVRMNLTAVRDEEGILRRHFLECIACARGLPAGIATLLDFGSGAGFPGIPIALCRPEISVTLAESHTKKAAFLQEALRTVNALAIVYSGRAEALRQHFDCVAMRAVDRMPEAVRAAGQLVQPDGWLALMTTLGELQKVQAAAGPEFATGCPVPLPGSEERILVLARRKLS